MQAASLPAPARAAALNRATTCIAASLRALLAAGEARVALGTPAVFGIGLMGKEDRVRSGRRRDTAYSATGRVGCPAGSWTGLQQAGGVFAALLTRARMNHQHAALSPGCFSYTPPVHTPTPPSHTPAGRPLLPLRPLQATALSLMNAAAASLQPVVAKLQDQFPSARLAVWDAATFTRNVTSAPPAAFGLANTTGRCLPESSGGGAPAELARPAAGGAGGRRRRRSLASARQAADSGGSGPLAATAAALAAQRPAAQKILAPHCLDPNKYLYWDGAHPTTAGHLLLARDFLAFLGRSLLLE
jgi:hypothetical protein